MKKGYYLLFSLFIIVLSVAGCSKDNDEEQASAPDISLNKSTLILEKGKDERLVASFTPADTPNKGHTWSSSAPDIAMVDETGMVTGVGLGESIITVTALDGRKTAKCNVTVTDKIINVTGVALSETDETLVAGETLQLEAIVQPSTATDKSVSWSSTDNKIASVDGNGIVTAISEGKTTIKATTNDGDKTASCKITVRGKGVDISKPEISDITSISAYVTGEIETFGVKVKECGICYSTSQSPTIENQKVSVSVSDEIAHTLTGLEPNTTYYARIYAIVDGNAKYGDQETFTTLVPVEISAPKVTSITTNSAYIEGTIKTFGLQTDETGICYSTSQRPTIDNEKVVLSNNNIGYTLNELAQETTYYVRIYAKVKGEVHYGEEGTFTTTGVIKTHFEPTDIYQDKIVLVSPGISGVKSLKVCYGKSPNPKITDYTTTATIGSDGKFHLTLNDLQRGPYYIRAYELNGSKVKYYADEVSVQTIERYIDCRRKCRKYEAYDYYDFNNFKYERFRFFYTYTYTIVPVGTYQVTTNNNVTIAKTTEYSTSIYLTNGTGSFEIKQELGLWWEYEGISKYMKFVTEGEIVFTDMESSIRYHWIVPSKCYVD